MDTIANCVASKSLSTVPVIIPAYEPDDRLIDLLNDLKIKKISPIIIVNDGSSAEYEHFFEDAEKYGATVLKHEVNCGKGRGLKTAFSYCLKQYPDLIGCITADSDGQHTPDAILDCMDELRKNDHSLVLGVRSFEGEEIPAKSQFGNNLTIKVFQRLYGVSITDTQTGLRGISKDFMRILLDVPGDRFEFETRMLIKATELRIPIEEISIETVYDSKDNHSTHFRPIVDSIRIYRVFGAAFGRFCLSSFSSSIIDLGLFHIFCSLLKNIHLGIQYVAMATVGARIISSIYNYLVNYFYVFQSDKSKKGSVIRYYLLAVIQMLCSALLTTGLVMLTRTNSELLIKVPVDVMLFLISYRIQKKYVY